MRRSHLTAGRILALLAMATLFSLAAPAVDATAIQATHDIPEEQLLDVAIEVLDPGIPDPASTPPKKLEGVFPDLRKSEARYIPMRLKDTLESTGYWGAVRVVPAGTSSADLTVLGEIRESSGLGLVVKIRSIDASGRKWLDKKYAARANYLVYTGDALTAGGPFQELYDEIANDLLAARQKLDADRLLELRKISELRFASEVAPDVYGDYLKVKATDNKRRYKLNKLPSGDDPMMVRISRIRERDYMLVDTLNEHYGAFVSSMNEPYDNWRSFSFEEQIALAELRRQARMRKILGALAIFGALVAEGDSTLERAARDAALIGGVASIQSGIAKGKEAKIHAEALAELATSFESEVAPLVVEVEGETVRLSGSREDQYTHWRQLLKEIYAAETGLPLDPNTSADLAVEDTSNP
jgi:hypothetical protein